MLPCLSSQLNYKKVDDALDVFVLPALPVKRPYVTVVGQSTPLKTVFLHFPSVVCQNQET